MAGREARAENLDPEFAHLHLEGAQRVAFHVEEGFAFRARTARLPEAVKRSE